MLMICGEWDMAKGTINGVDTNELNHRMEVFHHNIHYEARTRDEI